MSNKQIFRKQKKMSLEQLSQVFDNNNRKEQNKPLSILSTNSAKQQTTNVWNNQNSQNRQNVLTEEKPDFRPEEKPDFRPEEKKRVKLGKFNGSKGKKLDLESIQTLGKEYPSLSPYNCRDFPNFEVQISRDDYVRFCENRIQQRNAFDETNRPPVREFMLERFQAPKMLRDSILLNLLQNGVKIVCGINGRELLLIHKDTLVWTIMVSSTSASFDLSKNGKTIIADFRPTFADLEVQICFTHGDTKEPDFSRPPLLVEMISSLDVINSIFA